MNAGEQIDFYIDGHKLKRVDRFKYPGSYVTKDCKVDAEITARIQCVIPLMIYGSETLTLYSHHIKPLRTVHQRHLRSIPNIRWDYFITTTSTDIEITRIRNRLRWLCHVARMPDEWPVKALSYGELTEGSRRVGRPFLNRGLQYDRR